MVHQARIRNHVLDDVRGRMSERGCQTQDAREGIGNVRCDIAVSVEQDETSSPLAKRLWKTSSLRIVIAIRPRQIEPFFLPEWRIQTVLSLSLTCSQHYADPGCIQALLSQSCRSALQFSTCFNSTGLITLVLHSMACFDYLYRTQILTGRQSHKRNFAFPIYEYDFRLSDTRQSVRVLSA